PPPRPPAPVPPGSAASRQAPPASRGPGPGATAPRRAGAARAPPHGPLPEPGGGEGLVQRGLRLRIVCVGLEREAPPPRPHLERRPRPRRVTDQADRLGPTAELEGRDDTPQADCANREESRQRGVVRKLGRPLHRP